MYCNSRREFILNSGMSSYGFLNVYMGLVMTLNDKVKILPLS